MYRKCYITKKVTFKDEGKYIIKSIIIYIYLGIILISINFINYYFKGMYMFYYCKLIL